MSISAGCALSACGNDADRAPSNTAPPPAGGDAVDVDSEAAVGVVGGVVSQESSGLAWHVPAPTRTRLQKLIDGFNPVGVAWGATFTCSGDTLTPPFAGPAGDPYQFTPLGCMITWNNGKTTTSKWSGPFTLSYGTSCDGTHARLVNQTAGCSITRTTAAAGNTRTITGPNGSAYAITHDTNGAGTGWDRSVAPAPGNGGVGYSCSAAGCDERLLVIAGSHLTGTIAVLGGRPRTWWDLTVTTAAAGVTVTGKGRSRMVKGTVVTQHNLLRYTATTSFNDVAFGEDACCFPTAGSLSTTFSAGAKKGKTETVTFSPVCGEARVTLPNGSSIPWTFQHCL